VDLPAEECESLPLPIERLSAMSVSGQAKFHPLRYIQALADIFIERGGVIQEKCRVLKVDDDQSILQVETDIGYYESHHVIYATHVPPGITLIHLRYMPMRSYAMAVRLQSGEYPEDLAYDMYDPYHYYRTQEIDGEKYLIVGGEDHKTGDDTNTEAAFRKLESHIRTYFDVDKITHRWSSQYYEPADGMPYIGALPGHSDNILVATGFGGNGMTYGTLAALILTNIIYQEENPLIDLFSPSRIKPIAGFKNFVEHNTDVLRELMGKVFSKDGVREFAEIAPTEGRVIHVDRQYIGVYRDEAGALHTVHASCTHMGCNVRWNQAEKSWDCPCHGARYGVDGTVLNGPADRDLEYINLELVQPEGKSL
jgi:Rieske Fe-S protein